MSRQRPGNPIRRLPLPAFFVVVVLLWVGIRVVFAQGVLDPFRIGLDVLGGVVFATIATLGLRQRRRRLGGTDEALVYGRAARTGAVPAGADTAGWSAEIDRSERRLLVNRWVVRVGGLLPFGLGVWGTTEADSRVLGVVLIVLIVAGWITTEVSTPGSLARLERLRASLPR